MKTRHGFLTVLTALIVVIAACGGEDDTTDAADTTEADAADTTEAMTETTEAITDTTEAMTDTTEAMTDTTEAMTDTTEAMEDMGTVVDVAAAEESFSTLVAAVEAAGLTDALADPQATLTVFAPTNAAFEAALADLGLTADELLADTETLTTILTYHVLGETVTSADIAAAGSEEIPVEPLSGEELVVVVGDAGNVSFRDQTATVVTPDIEASNGVVHVIDAVLVPPSVSG